MLRISFFAIPASLALGTALAVAACSDTPSASADAGSDATTTSDGSTPPSDASSGSDTSTPSDATAQDATAEGGVLTPEEKAVCAALASRAQCFDGSGQAQACDEKSKCFYAKRTEPAAALEFAKCYGAPSCLGEDGCLAQAGAVAGGQAARDYVTACQAKLAECGASFDDEYCTTAAYAWKGAGAAATACLVKSCAEQKACFASVETTFVKKDCTP